LKSIFISVRSDSTRLPQKATLGLHGKPTIQYLIERLKKSKHADTIILCTTLLKSDDMLCKIAQDNNILYFRGSSEDKLKRWLGACQQYDVEFFVNADGDDLFFDAGLADLCFNQYESSGRDIDFIDGRGLYNDVYGIKTRALKIVCDIKSDEDTEFIRPYFIDSEHIKAQKLVDVPAKYEKQDIRMTLDYEEDLHFFSTIIDYHKTHDLPLSIENILQYIDENPEIKSINWHCEELWKNNQTKMISRIKKHSND